MEFVNFTPRRLRLTVKVGSTTVVSVAAPAQQDQSVLPMPDGVRVYLLDANHIQALDARGDIILVGFGLTMLTDEVGVAATGA